MSASNRDVYPRSPVADRPQKQASLTAQRIVREIEERNLQAGDHLPPEKEMLDDYGVGRGTLREALRVLELQGVLRIRPGPGGGPVVASPDSRHLASTLALLMQFAQTPFRAVMEARLHIEPITAGLCAERASDELLEDLRSSVDSMAANLGDSRAFLMENRRFHDLVAWGSQNPIFGYFINSLHWITDGTALGADYPERFRGVVHCAHADIYQGIVARDYDLAHAAMSEHISAALTYFEKHYRTLLDQSLSWEHYAI